MTETSIPKIHWGEKEERELLQATIGKELFQKEFDAYVAKEAVTTVCGHKIVPLYDRSGEPESFHVLHTVHTFATLALAIAYARSLPN